MRINAKVCLFAPSDLMWLGAPNPVLCEKELEIEITPHVLETFANESAFRIEGIRFGVWVKYNAIRNRVTLQGNLPNDETLEKIRELETNGWQFNREACTLYKLDWKDKAV